MVVNPTDGTCQWMDTNHTLQTASLNLDVLEPTQTYDDEPKARDLSLGFVEAPKAFSNELEVMKLYQAFSAELVRIALLGLTALAALIFAIMKVKGPETKDGYVELASYSRWVIVCATLLFGLSAAVALMHRYISSDSMASHLRLLRLEKRNPSGKDIDPAKAERKYRNRMLAYAGRSLFFASVFLAVGAFLFAAGIGLAILP